MRIIFLTSLAMILFAANSLLTRAGVGAGTEPITFALIRVAAGAGTLAALAYWARQHVPMRGPARRISAAALCAYLLGFSLAYLSLDAGVGALILFSTVQAGLFGAAIATREQISRRRWIGMGIALAASAWLLWPGSGSGSGASVSVIGSAWMVFAGLGWALYTWQGRSEAWALGGSAGNFLWSTVGFLALAVAMGGPASFEGAIYAVISGAVASGLGYALWFYVLPHIKATTAGLAQLSVPVIAVLGGSLWLGETVTTQIALACAGVLGGIALATVQFTRRSEGA